MNNAAIIYLQDQNGGWPAGQSTSSESPALFFAFTFMATQVSTFGGVLGTSSRFADGGSAANVFGYSLPMIVTETSGGSVTVTLSIDFIAP